MTSRSEAVRAQLDHPVVDCDGHVQEYLPAVMPFLREALGQPLFDRYRSQASTLAAIVGGASLEERTRRRLPQSSWWATPARNTRDLATAVVPRLLVERMGELGLDFAVLYPSKAMGSAAPDDEDLRRGLCRGWNDFFAATYLPFARHLTVAGIIPMHTPEEAVDELRHCRDIGLSVAAIPEGVRRPIPEPDVDGRSPWLFPGQTQWFDTFGIDSAYDYDPVWEAFRDLGFAVTAHGGMGQLAPNNFTSITNYSFNHIGAIAEKMHRMVKSLFMAGVTWRFPDLPIAVLECGVGWASTLLNDLVEHWEKRRIVALDRLDPDTIDWRLLEQLVCEYGPELVPVGSDVPADVRSVPAIGVPPEDRDEWRFVGARTEEELVASFTSCFYFGCEADDRTLAFAFSPANPLGARLRPVFSSDIGHWDVTDMAETLAEAWEVVEEELVTVDDFRDFVFDNPVKLLTGVNPGFFDGTVVADAVAGGRA